MAEPYCFYPSTYPTAIPSASPTAIPTAEPIAGPTVKPSAAPSARPTSSPTTLNDFIYRTCIASVYCTTAGPYNPATPSEVFEMVVCGDQTYCVPPTN